VTLIPLEAVSAGAQWRVVGGNWNDSGDELSGLSVGNHELEYKTITGWEKPGNETVSITAGQKKTISRAYVPVPSETSVKLYNDAYCLSGDQQYVITATLNLCDTILKADSKEWSSCETVTPGACLWQVTISSPCDQYVFNGSEDLASDCIYSFKLVKNEITEVWYLDIVKDCPGNCESTTPFILESVTSCDKNPNQMSVLCK
jgi:hypothetical protein